ncbi:DNA-binding protein [Rhodoferax antarcticus]|uniref:Putative kfra protein n=1 Tax=Rhodoferax antarcticus ANT.BR TaxID=1111071 RepID=A0A1Q8YBB9_9BURK|nr:DNA-binding protein [Rhodoferax antarcticus]APW46843.1 kfra protein [Rhodoferax antarcticus]OLP05348.1 putative kfra protein [Rhodoferax antarcticus ANT.BR]
MRPVEFSPESIITAGQDLQATGRNITGFALRQKVGGGNPSRLKQVWDEHLASQSVTKAEPVAELPVEVAEEVALVTKELTQRLAALAIELNDKAVKAAERRVHEVVRSAGEQRTQAERELADASQTVEDLESMVDEAASQVTGLEAKLAELQAVYQAQAVELAQVRERLAVTEQTAKVAGEQHAAELARMAGTIEAERARHLKEAEQLRAELLEQKKVSLGVSSERDQVRGDLAALTAKAEAIEQSRQEQRKAAELEARRAGERLAKAEASQEKSQQEASAAREDAANLRGQVDAMKNQVAEQMQVLAAGKP